MVAGAISVSSISRFSFAAALVFVGVELFLFFRDGDGVPYGIQINAHSGKTGNQKKKKNRITRRRGS